MKLVLALVLALWAPATIAADWSQAKPVNVVTTEYKFSPKRLVFEHGVPYHLHIENKGKELHEFTAPEFFKTLEIRDTAPLNADKVEIEIQPGTAKDLYFIAGRPGKFPLTCSDHDWTGMNGRITVR